MLSFKFSTLKYFLLPSTLFELSINVFVLICSCLFISRLLTFRFNQCFGVIGFLDWIHRTDEGYRKSENYKHDKILFGFKPISKNSKAWIRPIFFLFICYYCIYVHVAVAFFFVSSSSISSIQFNRSRKICTNSNLPSKLLKLLDLISKTNVLKIQF